MTHFAPQVASIPLSFSKTTAQVRWIEVEQKTKKSEAHSNPGGGVKASARKVDLTDLVPVWTKDIFKTSLLLGAKNSAQGSGQGPGLLDRGFLGGSGEALVHSKTFNLERWVYQRIESILTFPTELYNKRMSGEILVRLKWNRDGQWIESQSQLEGSNRYLRLHVRKVLRVALAQSLPDHLKWRLLDVPLSMDARFNFALAQNHDEKLAHQQKGFGLRQLFFYRSKPLRDTPRSEVPLSMSVVNGVPSLNVNPIWIFQKIKDAVSSGAKIDELDRYSDDPDF